MTAVRLGFNFVLLGGDPTAVDVRARQPPETSVESELFSESISRPGFYKNVRIHDYLLIAAPAALT